MIFYRSYTFILLQFFNVCDIFFKTRVIFAIEIIEFDTRNLFIVFLHEYISNYIDYPRSYFSYFFTSHHLMHISERYVSTNFYFHHVEM